jgi:hypothetical protein
MNSAAGITRIKFREVKNNAEIFGAYPCTIFEKLCKAVVKEEKRDEIRLI